MGVNIEIKARVHDLHQLRRMVEALSDSPAAVILQEDTFFSMPQGRLKLRVLAPDRGELIYYERENIAGPKRSTYHLVTTSDPGSLSALLTTALGLRGVVRKQRWLYKVGNTRIHLDAVDGLGLFLELEVVLTAGQTSTDGAAVAQGLLRQLGVVQADLIEVAYIDLLEKHRRDHLDSVGCGRTPSTE
jgi:predicted adenylyl cyclase CyaB